MNGKFKGEESISVSFEGPKMMFGAKILDLK